MKDISTKSNGDSVDASEWNPSQAECENVVKTSGQSLDEYDNFQIAKAMAIYAATGDWYVDTGAANTYVINKINLLKAPVVYLDGLSIRFLPANTNTTTSTVNVASLGVKTFCKDMSGSPIVAGDISSTVYVHAIYNAGLGMFVLQNPQTNVSGWDTGDVKSTYSATAGSGWLMLDDTTIGNAVSGATHADPSMQALFILLYTNIPDTLCPVSGGRTGNALNDFNANKTLTLAKILGKALAAATATTRVLGYHEGEYTHTLTNAELAAHSHSISNFPLGPWDERQAGGGLLGCTSISSQNTNSDGSGSAHNNTQPTAYINYKIKL